MSDILAKLAAPFPPERISWRVGPTNKEKTKGIALAYIDARDVMERLDGVMGIDWQCEYTPVPHGHCCRIGLLIEGHWRWRSNGAVNLSDSDKADAKEMAEKGSYSDAFKRAAVLWGVGRYLYDLDSPWVDIKELGRSYVIADSGKSQLLRVLTGKPSAPAHPEPPKSTMAGSKIEAEGARKAREWINSEAIPTVKACKSAEELNVWVAENKKRMRDAKEIVPDDFAALNHRIGLKADSFNTLAAG